MTDSQKVLRGFGCLIITWHSESGRPRYLPWQVPETVSIALLKGWIDGLGG
jgi:hypothetical protein